MMMPLGNPDFHSLYSGKVLIFSLMRSWSGGKIICLYNTWDKGFHYVILPEEGNQLDQIHLTLFHDITGERRGIDITPIP